MRRQSLASLFHFRVLSEVRLCCFQGLPCRFVGGGNWNQIESPLRHINTLDSLLTIFDTSSIWCGLGNKTTAKQPEQQSISEETTNQQHQSQKTLWRINWYGYKYQSWDSEPKHVDYVVQLKIYRPNQPELEGFTYRVFKYVRKITCFGEAMTFPSREQSRMMWIVAFGPWRLLRTAAASDSSGKAHNRSSPVDKSYILSVIL